MFDGGRFWILIRTIETQKLTDPTDPDPDPQHCWRYFFSAASTFFPFLSTVDQFSSLNKKCFFFILNQRLEEILALFEEDLIKCLAPTYIGDFSLPGRQLREKGINRIGKCWPLFNFKYRISMSSFYWKYRCEPLLRIRDVYPGSEVFHPGSRVKRFRIPDPAPHQRIWSNFNPKNFTLTFKDYISES